MIYNSIDIRQALLKDRIIRFTTEFNNNSCNAAIDQLLYLEHQDPDKDITIMIDSPGGDVHSGLALLDTIDYISCDVATIGCGMQASMGAVLLCSGTPGKRYMTKHSQCMIHQASSGFQGHVLDHEIRFNHTKKLNKILVERIAEKTGNTYKQILKLADRDLWLDSESSLKLGVIDTILEPKEK